MFKEVFNFTWDATKKSWLWGFIMFISDWIILIAIGGGLFAIALIWVNEILAGLIAIGGMIQYKTLSFGDEKDESKTPD